MKTTLRTDITVKDICDGFVYNQLEGAWNKFNSKLNKGIPLTENELKFAKGEFLPGRYKYIEQTNNLLYRKPSKDQSQKEIVKSYQVEQLKKTGLKSY